MQINEVRQIHVYLCLDPEVLLCYREISSRGTLGASLGVTLGGPSECEDI